jgi:hypothetical protein
MKLYGIVMDAAPTNDAERIQTIRPTVLVTDPVFTYTTCSYSRSLVPWNSGRTSWKEEASGLPGHASSREDR